MRVEFWLAVSVVTLMSLPVHADATCDQALADGQQLKAKRELIAAKRELLKCAQESCGEAMVGVCLPIFEEVEKALPSVIVVATRDGKEVFDASISVDGQELATTLDGRAHSVDPGRRTVRVVPKDAPLAAGEQELLVIEGEQRRKLVIELPSTSTKCAGADCAKPGQATGASGPRPAFVAGAVIGSLAVASWGAFAGFGAYGLTKESDELVAGGSTQQQIDDVGKLYTIADGFLVAASVLSAASVTAFIVGATTGPDTAGHADAARVELGPLQASLVVSF